MKDTRQVKIFYTGVAVKPRVGQGKTSVCHQDDSYIHACVHIIGHYNPPVRIIDLVSHTTYVVCVKVAGPTV